MTYTLVFRVTREVWDALEDGTKTSEYRDCKPFWDARMEEASAWLRAQAKVGITQSNNVEALFLGPRGAKSRHYEVSYVRLIPRDEVPERWRGYLTTPEIWAVELGRKIEEAMR